MTDTDAHSQGNGCSATQFVPVMSEGSDAVSKVTQFSRQAHWLAERPNPTFSPWFKLMMKWVPGVMRLYRAKLYWDKEKTFSGFNIQSGSKERDQWAAEATDYIRRNAPPRYIDALVPKILWGCKRNVNDTGYLDCLHRPNVELIYDDPIVDIVEEGIQTVSGRKVKADAIILATGFQTQRLLSPMDIRGEEGTGVAEHVSFRALVDLSSLIVPLVGYHNRRISFRIFRYLSHRLSQFLHDDGTQHHHRSPFGHLHSRMSNQLHHEGHQATPPISTCKVLVPTEPSEAIRQSHCNDRSTGS